MTTPARAKGEIKATKYVSEAVRERETYRFHYNNSGKPLQDVELTTSKDSVLTALAQLGTYQTSTDRAMISLFDTSHQYIIAEATPSLPLNPGLKSESLWLCGTAIPRDHWVCDSVVRDTYIAFEAGKSPAVTELPFTIIRGITEDERSKLKPYSQDGPSPKFYAAVPIRSRRGINIGVYCVLSSNPEQPWSASNTQHLRDISYAIMDHVESVRARNFNRRNERMTRGLGSFIEGKATISGWQERPNSTAFTDDNSFEGALNANQQIAETKLHESLHQQDQELRDGDSTDRVETSKKSAREMENDASKNLMLGPNSSALILSRAANIIRESFEVEGFMLFDVSVGPQRTPPPVVEIKTDGSPGQSSSTSSSDEQKSKSDAHCRLLAFSNSEGSSVDGKSFDGADQLLPKSVMAKLLRRYPTGKIFNFNEEGELQTSDYSEDDVWSTAPPVESEGNSGRGPNGMRRLYSDQHFGRSKEGQVIHKAFPNARSVAFVPTWDSKRQRWFVGGFLYTLMPTRIFTGEEDLSFLKAFSMIAATEVLNMEALQADKAKSDTLGSLSHELRSPLHGVILGTELLNDTDLDVFQENSVHTIETCCRTLLETMDHLLDYSKINSLTAKRKTQEANTALSKLRKRARSNYFTSNKLYSNVRLDGLVEEVIDSVFAGFNLQHRSVGQLSRQMDKKAKQDVAARQLLDSTQAREQLTTDVAAATFGGVAVYILVDHGCNWAFNVETGAVRRILMNLFGNALKYTSQGTIKVSLTQIKTTAGKTSKPGETLVQLTVQDTGKGISEDYLQHNLFKPFAQEDDLAPGTGLGLSIVKQIASQLHGKISVTSHIGRGTTATVRLPLQIAEKEYADKGPEAACFSDEDVLFEERAQDLSGLRIRLAGFGASTSATHSSASENESHKMIRNLCSEWLHVNLITDDEDSEKKAPDVVVWSDDALPRPLEYSEQLSKTPNVVICKDALVAYERYRTYKSAGHAGVFEFVSQPIGARKLAKFISLAYKRWMGLEGADMKSGPGASTESISTQPNPPQSTDNKASSEGRELNVNDRQSEPRSSHSPARSKPPPSLETHDSSPETGNKMLVVDDNQVNLKVLATYMKKVGFAYTTAVNGKEAVDIYTSSPSDYVGIIMDISMPVMNGYEATRAIRTYEHDQKMKRVPILALTGLASEEAHNDAVESGVDMFLTKPVKLRALEGILESIDILPKGK